MCDEDKADDEGSYAYVISSMAWIGMAGPFEGGSLRLLVLCSESCAKAFLEAGG